MTDLLKLRRRLEEKKDEVRSLEGRRDQLLDQLKEEHGCSSVEEAESRLTELENEHESLVSKLEDRIQSFRKKYRDLLDDDEDEN